MTTDELDSAIRGRYAIRRLGDYVSSYNVTSTLVTEINGNDVLGQ